MGNFVKWLIVAVLVAGVGIGGIKAIQWYQSRGQLAAFEELSAKKNPVAVYGAAAIKEHVRRHFALSATDNSLDKMAPSCPHCPIIRTRT
jgi:hypothetical protein